MRSISGITDLYPGEPTVPLVGLVMPSMHCMSNSLLCTRKISKRLPDSFMFLMITKIVRANLNARD